MKTRESEMKLLTLSVLELQGITGLIELPPAKAVAAPAVA